MTERCSITEKDQVHYAGLLWRGMERYRRSLDPDDSWPCNTSFFVHSEPEIQVPRLASMVAEEMPEDTFLHDSLRVKQLFNIISLGSEQGSRWSLIPYLPVDNDRYDTRRQ